ncbi:MAG: tetratricopeptide repeat protein [Acidobacteriota bacterium]
MVRRPNGRRAGLVLFSLLATLAFALPAAAQGLVQGVVTDAQGQPIDGASVVIEAEGTNRHFDMKTNKKGEFMQIGLSSGPYKVTATKDKLTATQSVRISQGRPANAKLVLGAAAPGAPGEAAAATALRKVLDEAVAATNAGKFDDAIAGFTKAAELQPTCFACFYNIGYAHAQKKDYDNAESNYKKAIELKADYADAYAGLASLYNAQRKFDLAAAASAKASELSSALGAPGGATGGADALFNQGVVLWNGGKIADAKKAFEGAIQANPNHAEAHYQLGMALVNEGNLAGATTEFESYLKLAPEGPNAATAKGLVAQLKK